MTRAVPITLAAYNDPMVQGIVGPLLPYLHPGDEIDLVSGNQDHPLSVPQLNRWADGLADQLPPGTLFAAHMSGIDKIASAAVGLSVRFPALLLDYEPNFDPAFTWEFAPTLAHIDQFSAICRANGRRAVAYPTGRPLQERPLQVYAWDYALLKRHADDAYPQTQHWASLGAGPWANALATLRSHHARNALDPRSIVVQLTLGQGGNAIPADAAVQRYHEALVGGLRRLYLWWSPPMQGELAQFLAAIDA
jgi:hypothetical protein